MTFINPSAPNLADFTTFVYAQGVASANLPPSSDYLIWALNYGGFVALIPPPGMPTVMIVPDHAPPYVMAVYNVGMHQLLKIAQDISPSTYFSDLRKTYNFLSFIAGPIIASSDQSTGETLLAADWMKSMTLSALDLLKTPWGRDYLAYAQAYGPNIVGIS